MSQNCLSVYRAVEHKNNNNTNILIENNTLLSLRKQGPPFNTTSCSSEWCERSACCQAKAVRFMKIGEELGRNIRPRPPLRSRGKKQKTGLVPGYNQANPAIRIPIKLKGGFAWMVTLRSLPHRCSYRVAEGFSVTRDGTQIVSVMPHDSA